MTSFPKDYVHKIKRYSNSEQIQASFLKNRVRRNIAAFLYVTLYLVYLGWRVTIFHDESLLVSNLYFLAECFGFILGLTIIIASRDYNHRESKPVLHGREVDVLVPTYKEPIEVIRNTLRAAKEINYPHKTFVLDDARRQEVKALAEELEINYLSRPNNINAKAGNLNFGLAHSKAEFVLVFDADHVALADAIDMTLGFFVEDKLAMVQTPQCYYNNNAFQYTGNKSDPNWHDQMFFFNRGLACADSYNAASCVGTGVVYRRSALEAIGGIPTETVTEDIHTAIKFHKAGFLTAYFNEPIAYGEAAPDLNEYYKTRHRWGHGNIHALMHENILFCKGLSLRQRVHYLIHGLIHLEGWQQLILIMVPLSTLIFGLKPFEISVFNIAVVMIFPLLSYVFLRMVGNGYIRYWQGEILAMARWPIHLKATLGLVGKPIPWLTTRKGFKSKIKWRLMMPQIMVMLASLAACFYGFVKLNNDFRTGPLFDLVQSLILSGKIPAGTNIFLSLDNGYTADLVIIAGFWALYNSIRVLFFVRKTIRNSQQSEKYFRFPAIFSIKQGKFSGCSVWVSEEMIEYELERPTLDFSKGEIISLTLMFSEELCYMSVKVSDIIWDNQKSCFRITGFFVGAGKQRNSDRLASYLYKMQWLNVQLKCNVFSDSSLISG